jgi:uncharacterized protein YraI
LTSTQVNVRSGPDAASESLGLLQNGSQVEVVGRDASGQWLAIAFAQSPTGIGWVTAQFIDLSGEIERLTVLQQAAAPQSQPANPVSAPPSSPTPETEKRTARTTAQINARSGPSSAFDSLGLLSANTTVTLTGRNQINTWVQIEYPENSAERAWIAVAYIEYQGFLDSLPVFDNDGNPIQPAPESGPANILPTNAPQNYQPATEDLDSTENPAVRVSFIPSGARRIIYSSDLSAPTGDNADWIEFTVDTAQANQVVFVYFKLECSGNGAISAELRQNGLLVSEFPGLLCGQYGVAFKALGDTPYLLRLQADGSATDLRYVAYNFYLSTNP